MKTLRVRTTIRCIVLYVKRSLRIYVVQITRDYKKYNKTIMNVRTDRRYPVRWMIPPPTSRQIYVIQKRSPVHGYGERYPGINIPQ